MIDVIAIDAFISGFGLSLSLILAIGAQNAFVLRQGLRQEYVFWVCLVCALSDALLILAGVFGFGLVVQSLPWLDKAMRYGGSAFLIIYGLRSFWAAWRLSGTLQPSDSKSKSLLATILTCLMLTWLNPHVYLDTVVLIGSISTQFHSQATSFAFGAMLASFVFFFSLGYGARLLRPLFAKVLAWQILEIFVGLVMWLIAAHLLFNF